MPTLCEPIYHQQKQTLALTLRHTDTSTMHGALTDARSRPCAPSQIHPNELPNMPTCAQKRKKREKIRGEQIGKNYDDIFGVLVTVNIKVTESMCALTQNIRHTYIHDVYARVTEK